MQLACDILLNGKASYQEAKAEACGGTGSEDGWMGVRGGVGSWFSSQSQTLPDPRSLFLSLSLLSALRFSLIHTLAGFLFPDQHSNTHTHSL